MSADSGSPDWVEEANAVINDIKPHVNNIKISNLTSTKQNIFFNMTTLEKNDFCVELSHKGFTVVGEKFDSQELKGKYSTHETPYSMLNSLSPAYRDSFGQQLLEKLTKLKSDREREEEMREEETRDEKKAEES